jgi:hypothetical protein
MIAIWPLGYPLFALGMLIYYRVPQMASKKIQMAEFHAILRHAINILVHKQLPLHGLHEQLDTLTDAQLRVLVDLYNLGEEPESPQTTDLLASADGLPWWFLVKTPMGKKVKDLISNMRRNEELVVPLHTWEPDSNDAGERLACRRIASLFIAYEPEFWW